MGENPLDVFAAETDQFLIKAKNLVADNYNEHRNPEKSEFVPADQIRITWYCKVLGNWKAICSAEQMRGLIYEVSFNGVRDEAYVDVYKKIANVKVRGK